MYKALVTFAAFLTMAAKLTPTTFDDKAAEFLNFVVRIAGENPDIVEWLESFLGRTTDPELEFVEHIHPELEPYAADVKKYLVPLRATFQAMAA